MQAPSVSSRASAQAQPYSAARLAFARISGCRQQSSLWRRLGASPQAPRSAKRSLAACRAAEQEGNIALTPDTVVVDEFFEVEKVLGVRASLEGEDPVVEYRVKWKDGKPDTWELATNISPDLVRDFDNRWWNAARKGEEAVMREMLKYSRDLLPQVVDDNGRSALHFAAAVNNVPCVQLLLAAGAEPDLQDREGYTPLHMAAGYSQTATMMALLEGGADPLLRDNKGQDVPLLIDGLRAKMPPVAAMLQRRMALEQVAAVLTRKLYDEVEVAGVLEERPGGDDGEREFLVQFKDGAPDAWVLERDLAPDVIEDWEAGMERAEVAAVVDMVQWGTERQFLVQWADGSKDSWEAEENVPPELVDQLRQQRPDLFKGIKKRGGRGGGGSGGSGRRRRGGKGQGQQQQAAAAAAGGDASSSGHAGGAPNGHVHASAAAASQQSHEQQQGQQQQQGNDAATLEPVPALR